MAWKIEVERAAARELTKLDSQAADRVLRFLRDRVAPLDDPRSIDQALKGDRFGEFWRYRMVDYRIVARIVDSDALILVLRIGHRREIYR
jgi:mRNA interferase RelE/StbE